MKKWAQIRKARKISQYELADRSGVARWRIALAELGHRKLSHEDMDAIRRVLQPPTDVAA